MSTRDSDGGFFIIMITFAVIGCLLGSGYAMNEGYAASKVVGHGLIGLASGAMVPIVLLITGVLTPLD